MSDVKAVSYRYAIQGSVARSRLSLIRNGHFGNTERPTPPGSSRDKEKGREKEEAVDEASITPPWTAPAALQA